MFPMQRYAVLIWPLLSYNILSITFATAFKAHTHCFQVKIYFAGATLDNMTGPASMILNGFWGYCIGKLFTLYKHIGYIVYTLYKDIS